MRTPSDAAALLLEHYGLAATLSALPGDRDQNYLAQAFDGKRYVLKLMHSGCSADAVELQCAALLQLRNSGPAVPQVIPSLCGQALQQVKDQDGGERLLWLLSWCPGTLLADFRPHLPPLQRSFGRVMARIAVGLKGLDHPGAHLGHRWELTRALECEALLPYIDPQTRPCVAAALATFGELQPQLQQLPQGLIHNDANDYNVLVEYSGETAVVSGLFDFGDMSWQPLVCDIAIALAYLVMDKQDPLDCCMNFLRGYCELRPLSEPEVELLLPLILTRLAVSIAISSQRQLAEPNDPYLTISQAPARAALAKLQHINTSFACCALRDAAGLPLLPQQVAVMRFIEAASPLCSRVIDGEPLRHSLDLSIGSPMLGADPANATLAPLTRLVDEELQLAGVTIAAGRYAEPRGLYNTAGFGDQTRPTAERRTEHIGLDIFCAPGTPVRTPLDAVVEFTADNRAALDYGPVVVLRHHTPDGHHFFTLYGHLQRSSLENLRAGQTLTGGEAFAAVGKSSENGGWTPHLHLQIILDLLHLGADFPGVVAPTHARLWRELCPNPALLLPDVDAQAMDGRPDDATLLLQRKQRLAGSLSLSYKRPLHIVRGFRQYLYDSQARAYLDAYNNVAHVGHSHPHVVRAAQRQLALLNTNTRYLHHNIVDYAAALCAKLPHPLDVCLFVNSASEANELALRLARNYTGARDVCAMQAAYHGHTSTLIDMSPYKYNGPGGSGRPDWVHEVTLPDDYRGPFKRDDPNAGLQYAAEIGPIMDAAIAQGRGIAAFFAETLPSVGGQIVLPPGYLGEAYEQVRQRGALCIADEVQVGFGRLGKHFWGFEEQAVTPDIVVLGKPIANGFPLGAVITSSEIAAAFDNGMEFFSTYGGNPVACAAGQAVLEVLDREQLQANALARGAELSKGLLELKSRHRLLGDARGHGLFQGLELVTDRETLRPAAREAAYVVERLRDMQVLAGTDGPLHNVIKLRPSMVTEPRDVMQILECLDETLREAQMLPAAKP